MMFLLASALFLWNCEGEPGPPGPPGNTGPQGPQGPQSIALMYEVIFDLNQGNGWTAFYEFPADDEIYIEDVVLVYLLWEQQDIGGETFDVWRLMPVNFYENDGVVSMLYDFTAIDVKLFAEAAFELNTNIAYQEEIARIVVIPADYSANARVNYQDYYAVAEAFGLPDKPVVSRTDANKKR